MKERKDSKARRITLSLLIVGVVGAVVGVGTLSAFSSSTSNSGNNFDAGTVYLTDNDAGSALYNVTNRKPGNTVTSCIKVTYGGTLPSDVHLYTLSTIGTLGKYMDMTVEKGTSTGAAFPGCGTFTSGGERLHGHARRLRFGPELLCERQLAASPAPDRVEPERHARVPVHVDTAGRQQRERPGRRRAAVRLAHLHLGGAQPVIPPDRGWGRPAAGPTHRTAPGTRTGVVAMASLGTQRWTRITGFARGRRRGRRTRGRLAGGPGTGTVGADVTFVATPTGELDSRPVRSSGASGWSPATRPRARSRSATRRAARSRSRCAPSRPSQDLDPVLQVRHDGRPSATVYEGTLGGLRDWSTPFRLGSGKRAAPPSALSLPAASDRGEPRSHRRHLARVPLGGGGSARVTRARAALRKVLLTTARRRRDRRRGRVRHLRGFLELDPTNSANSFAAGTVDVADDDANGALISLSNAKPGDSATGCIKVSYTGTLASNVRLYGTVATGTLAPYLTLTVTRGTKAAGLRRRCSGFTADSTNYIGAGTGVIYSGRSQRLPGNWAAGIVDRTTAARPRARRRRWTNPSNHVYKFVDHAANDNNAQGLSGAPRSPGRPRTHERNATGSTSSQGRSRCARVPPSRSAGVDRLARHPDRPGRRTATVRSPAVVARAPSPSRRCAVSFAIRPGDAGTSYRSHRRRRVVGGRRTLAPIPAELADVRRPEIHAGRRRRGARRPLAGAAGGSRVRAERAARRGRRDRGGLPGVDPPRLPVPDGHVGQHGADARGRRRRHGAPGRAARRARRRHRHVPRPDRPVDADHPPRPEPQGPRRGGRLRDQGRREQHGRAMVRSRSTGSLGW